MLGIRLMLADAGRTDGIQDVQRKLFGGRGNSLTRTMQEEDCLNKQVISRAESARLPHLP